MPPQSPDLNPIENLWHILDMKRNEEKNSNKSELRGKWLKITSKTCHKLF